MNFGWNCLWPQAAVFHGRLGLRTLDLGLRWLGLGPNVKRHIYIYVILFLRAPRSRGLEASVLEINFLSPVQALALQALMARCWIVNLALLCVARTLDEFSHFDLPVKNVSGAMSALLRFLSFCVCICGVLGGVWRESSGAFASATGGRVVNYAEVRARVTHGFVEKANEMADAIAVLQDLSRATVDLTEQITKHCSK